MLEFSDKDFKTSIMKYSTEQGNGMEFHRAREWNQHSWMERESVGRETKKINKIQMTILELKHIIAEILKPG